MAPYHFYLGEIEPADMSQDTSTNDLLSDDDDLVEELPSLPLIPVPDILPTEHSLPQLLSQTCGGGDLHEVTSIRLKVIASQVNLQRLHIYLPNLAELDLSGSHLQSLRPLGYGLENLSVLRVGRCSLSSLDGVFGVSGLQELYAPNNSITELGLLATLPQLRVLDMRSNPVASLQQVGFLSMCVSLRELTLAECPVAELPGYKACVVTTLPALGQLDGYLLADAGSDVCQESKQDSSDHPDDDDGAQTLGVEDLKIQDESDAPLAELQPVRPRVGRARPATASGARPSQRSYMLQERPATASGKRATDCQLNVDGDPDIMTDDTVSKLTSGGIVCGNLAAALRSKHRQRKPAWNNKDGDERLQGKNGLTITKMYEEVESIEAARLGAGDIPSLSQPLLDASRRWREAYHSFRTTHKEQWEKEEFEDNEK